MGIVVLYVAAFVFWSVWRRVGNGRGRKQLHTNSQSRGQADVWTIEALSQKRKKVKRMLPAGVELFLSGCTEMGRLSVGEQSSRFRKRASMIRELSALMPQLRRSYGTALQSPTASSNRLDQVRQTDSVLSRPFTLMDEDLRRHTLRRSSKASERAKTTLIRSLAC